MIKAIAHFCIQTLDLAETERFYCQGLGLTKKFNFLKDDQVVGFYLQINEHNFIEVFQVECLPEDRPSRLKHVSLEVYDLNQTITALKAFGAEITEKIMKCDHAWQAYLTDPNGIKIELQQYTDKSCQITGCDSIRP